MTTVTWKHGNIALTRAYVISEIMDFHNKMLEVGLIDYTGENVNKINELATNTSKFEFASKDMNTYTTQWELVDLRYKMPTGDGSIKFADVVGEDYKTVVEESYDSTECYILFRFMHTQLVVGYYHSISISNLSSYFALSCNFNVSSNDTFDVANDINLFKPLSVSSAQLNMNETYRQQYAMVHLSGSHFFIYWRDTYRSANQSLLAHTTQSIPRLLFSIYRNKGNISVFYPNFPTTSTYMSTSKTTASYTYAPYILHIDKYNTYGTITNTINIMQGAVLTDGASFFNNKNYVLQTYTFHRSNVEQNPTVFRVHLNNYPVTNTPVYSDLIIKYKGQKVMMKYLNYGSMSEYFRWRLLNITGASTSNEPYNATSYLFMINDHPCTTDSVN